MTANDILSQNCVKTLALVLVLAVSCLPRTNHAAIAQTPEQAKKHWAFQPLSNPALPRVHDRKRIQSHIDAFLLAKLETRQSTFAPPADKRALLRRAYYDLI